MDEDFHLNQDEPSPMSGGVHTPSHLEPSPMTPGAGVYDNIPSPYTAMGPSPANSYRQASSGSLLFRSNLKRELSDYYRASLGLFIFDLFFYFRNKNKSRF